MDLAAYRDEIKLRLTGEVLDLEIEDSTIDKIINSAFREIQRYIDITQYETIPFSPCIDLNPRKINMIAQVYRAESLVDGSGSGSSTTMDPMYAASWQIYTGNGFNYNYSDYVSNFAAYNSVLQMKNTLSTDLSFKYDRVSNKLYINTMIDKPSAITIEYIPRFENVEEIVSDFWIDIIVKLSIALTKVTLGRIRTRYTQSGALWAQDGDALLSEGNSELADIREKLKASTQLVYGID